MFVQLAQAGGPVAVVNKLIALSAEAIPLWQRMRHNAHAHGDIHGALALQAALLCLHAPRTVRHRLRFLRCCLADHSLVQQSPLFVRHVQNARPELAVAQLVELPVAVVPSARVKPAARQLNLISIAAHSRMCQAPARSVRLVGR